MPGLSPTRRRAGHLGGVEACAGGPQICVAMREEMLFCVLFGLVPKMGHAFGLAVGEGF